MGEESYVNPRHMDQVCMHLTETVFYQKEWEQSQSGFPSQGRAYLWSGWSRLAALHLQCLVANPWSAACGPTLPGSGWPSQCKSVEQREGRREMGRGKGANKNSENKCWIQREAILNHIPVHEVIAQKEIVVKNFKQLFPPLISCFTGRWFTLSKPGASHLWHSKTPQMTPACKSVWDFTLLPLVLSDSK